MQRLPGTEFAIACAMVGAGIMMTASSAYGQERYPNRPIRLLIPMAAGGSSDILMRTLSPKMSDLLGQQIVIDNRPGANGVIGEEMVARAAPDGYTWLVTSIAIAINPSLYKPSYNVLTDLTPVSQLAYGDKRRLEIGLALATSPSLLLLDEPLAGMSPPERVETVKLLKSISRGRTMIIIDHDMDALFELAERVTVLQEGRVLVEGTPEEIKNNATVQEAYLGGVQGVLAA